MKKTHILIAGGGPVGVVAGLACAQYGYAVTLLEAEDRIDDNPRAATTHPSTLEMIARVGLIDPFIQEGLVARYFQFWDKPSRTKIVEFDHDNLRDETPYPFVVQTEQHKLARMGIERLKSFADAEVRFATRVTGVTQDANGARITADGPEGSEVFHGDYVIGADGGRSMIRKALDIAFEGFTWPEHFLVLTTLDDFQELLPGCCYRNYLADPDEWTNLFKVSGDDGKGRWRAVFPTRTEESDEEALGDASTYSRLQRVFPLSRRYNVVHRNLYKVHQRVAATFRSGRVFLAGDSAHVNNSVGGLGLNGGIHDAIELVDTLHQVIMKQASEDLLDRYTRRRRTLNIEFVQEQTINNKKRLEEREPKAREARFDELRAIAEDPVKHKEFLLRTSLIASVRKAHGME
ncbi:MAG TPA: FAD-dependent monooxygenase [Candidatus Saccharimonadales bacterium]|nr:FAD-dependent monooxygenase [Candidatus Saccharimonadales bacterium]